MLRGGAQTSLPCSSVRATRTLLRRRGRRLRRRAPCPHSRHDIYGWTLFWTHFIQRYILVLDMKTLNMKHDIIEYTKWTYLCSALYNASSWSALYAMVCMQSDLVVSCLCRRARRQRRRHLRYAWDCPTWHTALCMQQVIVIERVITECSLCMQNVLVVERFICTMSLLLSALYAKCPYYVVLDM